MESDLQQHPQVFRQQHHQQPVNSGLVRYRSAPSSYFQEQIDRELCSQFFKKPSSPETERIFARFMSSGAEDASAQNLGDFGQESIIKEEIKVQESQLAQILPQINQEVGIQQQQLSNYASSSENFYQSQSQLPLPNQNPCSAINYTGTSSTGMHQLPPMRTGDGLSTNLIRHSSSPAGLFADLDIEAALSSVGNFSAAGKMQTQENYLAGQPPASSGLMSPIAKIENKSMKAGSPEMNDFGQGSINDYTPSFVTKSWEDPVMMSESLNSLKRRRDDDGNAFAILNATQKQSGNPGVGRPPLLTHHLSLPKTLPDMESSPLTMQYPNSVPCKIRAKRGFATHPRSIAERVRRTKISERMRRLQELVPNMDKQANTTEMLDLAVEYIIGLQSQVKTIQQNANVQTSIRSSKESPEGFVRTETERFRSTVDHVYCTGKKGYSVEVRTHILKLGRSHALNVSTPHALIGN